MELVFRHAAKKDLPALKKIFRSWAESDPGILDMLNASLSGGEDKNLRCAVLEAAKTIRAGLLWYTYAINEVRVVALGTGPGASELDASERLLKEQILEWSEESITKVTIKIPAAMASSFITNLKSCGFMLEGISSRFGTGESPEIRMCKHLLHRSVPYSGIMQFLKELLVSLGYEVRPEGEDFGYRVKNEYRLPFIHSSWHRITRNGPDIIVHPPARILELHELETLFFPLTIRTKNDRPLLLPMEKKRAVTLIDLPPAYSQQDSLFGVTPLNHQRDLRINNLTYSYPTGIQKIRKGLPILFYVNRMGAVGSGRIEEWYLDEPKNLYNKIDEMGYFDPEDVKEYAASSGPKSGKVMVIRFAWYRPLKRTVPLEEIRTIDDSFNPQRTRSLSSESFKAIIIAGNSPA
jgi:hypothetical protein